MPGAAQRLRGRPPRAPPAHPERRSEKKPLPQGQELPSSVLPLAAGRSTEDGLADLFRGLGCRGARPPRHVAERGGVFRELLQQ
eukprot:2023249-Pyramimonas_sp.AAC.1